VLFLSKAGYKILSWYFKIFDETAELKSYVQRCKCYIIKFFWEMTSLKEGQFYFK